MMVKGAVFRAMAEALQDDVRNRRTSRQESTADEVVTAIQHMNANMLLLGSSILDRLDQQAATSPQNAWAKLVRDGKVVSQ
tara:strand:- start:2176 stop:2418 length:243 start_codon:yes stop_codon:yes gene_type:complete